MESTRAKLISDLLYHSFKGIVPKSGSTIIIEWIKNDKFQFPLTFKEKIGWLVFFNKQLKAKYGDTS